MMPAPSRSTGCRPADSLPPQGRVSKDITLSGNGENATSWPLLIPATPPAPNQICQTEFWIVRVDCVWHFAAGQPDLTFVVSDLERHLRCSRPAKRRRQPTFGEDRGVQGGWMDVIRCMSRPGSRRPPPATSVAGNAFRLRLTKTCGMEESRHATYSYINSLYNCL